MNFDLERKSGASADGCRIGSGDPQRHSEVKRTMFLAGLARNGHQADEFEVRGEYCVMAASEFSRVLTDTEQFALGKQGIDYSS
jgi:hypothetical protein